MESKSFDKILDLESDLYSNELIGTTRYENQNIQDSPTIASEGKYGRMDKTIKVETRIFYTKQCKEG